MSEASQPPPTYPLYLFFLYCHHKQKQTNHDLVKPEIDTWMYCRKCRTHRMIGDIKVD